MIVWNTNGRTNNDDLILMFITWGNKSEIIRKGALIYLLFVGVVLSETNTPKSNWVSAA